MILVYLGRASRYPGESINYDISPHGPGVIARLEGGRRRSSRTRRGVCESFPLAEVESVGLLLDTRVG
jgi:hypothetical protein